MNVLKIGNPEIQRFKDTGFASEYQDGGNQVRHAAAYIIAGARFTDPALLGDIASFRELGLENNEVADYRLGIASAALGGGLLAGTIPVSQAGQWLRDNLSVASPNTLPPPPDPIPVFPVFPFDNIWNFDFTFF